MDVLDLQAEITAVEQGVYEVVLRSPDGAETSARARLALTPDELRTLVARIPDAVIASSTRVRRSVGTDEQPIQLLGRSLFDTLTAGDGRALLATARHGAARTGAQLRLVLKVRPPELAFLPWEFLFDAASGGYLCTTTPLIRHPQVAIPQRPLHVDPPLRVLCMIARPGDQETLAVEAERQRLRTALEGLRRDGLIELGWVGGETWRDLRTALRHGNGPWHVFHFIGHGGFDRAAAEGTLALDDGAGGTYPLGAENLAMVLHGCSSLRLVVLNACETGRASSADPFSSVGGALMRAGLPAALVMQYPISDQAAVEFSQSFYEELAQGRTVDAAVTEARQSVRLALPGTLEWGTPVLYMRSLDGTLFDVSAARKPAAAPVTQVGDLYVQGLAALYTERWDDAVAAFRAVLSADGAYENGAAKLEEALRGRRLAHLYTAARGAADAGQWDDAIAHLSTILTAAPGYRDAQERLQTARARKETASLRAEARALHAAGQWAAVLAIGDRLAELLPGDPDPDGVLAEARRRVGGTSRAAGEDAGRDRRPTRTAEPPAPSPDPPRDDPSPAPADRRVLHLTTPMKAWSAAFAPDGGSVAIGGADGELVFRGVPPRADPTTAPGPGQSTGGEQSRPFQGTALTMGNLTVIAVTAAYTLWKDRRRERTPVTQERVRSLAFRPDGRQIAVGDGTKVVLRDIAGETKGTDFTVGRYDVTAMAFCGNSTLAVASHHTVALWSVDRPTRLRTFDHEDSVYALAVTRDGRRLATAGHSHIRVWDIATGERTLTVDYHPMVFAVDFSPDGTRLVTGALDHTARFWDTTTGDCPTRLELPDRVRGVALGPTGDTLAVASGQAVTLLDLTTGRTVLERDGDFGEVTLLQIAYSPDGTHLLTVGDGNAWLIPVPKEAS